MEEILQSIAEAEEKAIKIKENAQARVTEIAQEADARATELEKQVEAECKLYREKTLKAAEQRAQEEYDHALKTCRAEAEKYADDLLNNTEVLVGKIAGRVCGDR